METIPLYDKAEPEPEHHYIKPDDQEDDVYVEAEDVDEFQDVILKNIYDDLVVYIGTNALSLCEHLTIDDVEDIIESRFT